MACDSNSSNSLDLPYKKGRGIVEIVALTIRMRESDASKARTSWREALRADFGRGGGKK